MCLAIGCLCRGRLRRRARSPRGQRWRQCRRRRRIGGSGQREKASKPANDEIISGSEETDDTGKCIRAKIQLQKGTGPIYEIKIDEGYETYTLYDEKGNEVNSKSTAWNGKFWDGSTPYIELFKTNIDGHPWGTLLKVSSTERFGLRFIWY